MNSEIYKACEQGDVDVVRMIIETSPITTDINCIEPNDSTALHVACYNDHTNVVKLLLYEYNVQRHHIDRSGHTAYEISSNEIRELFRRPADENNHFCTDINFPDPFELINQNTPAWNKFYPTAAPLKDTIYFSYTPGGFSIPHNGYMYHIQRFFGFDPDKNNIEKWSTFLQNFFNERLSSFPTTYLNASRCLAEYVKTRKIEHLFRLYTLSQDICKHLAQDKNLLDCFYAAISYYLPSVRPRAYQGICYRGLTMTENNFEIYRRALENKGSFLGMNTFSSTSKKRDVVMDYINEFSDEVHVVLTINFTKKCPTAIDLSRIDMELPNLSQFEDEKEVLILPGTVFSVTKIDYNIPLREVHLEYYDASAEVGELIVDNIQTQLEDFF